MRGWLRRFRLLALISVAALATGPLHAQSSGSRTVVPGPGYAAHGVKEALLGDSYRDQWTSPLRVEVLDLGSYAGGLKPLKLGGGLQTKSLRFAGADGKEYTFRSVDKYPDLAAEPALHGTIVGRTIQDQTSSLHIGGPLAVPVMLDALGVLHATPRLFLMPDDPRLGEFRAQFAGMLGTVEERIDDQEKETPGFGGFTRILDTPTLFKRLEDSADDRIDARGYLTARLFDLLINDWDRHEDQWRWAAVDSGGVRWWKAIPRDRDYAFVDYDGLAMALARRMARNTVEFTDEIHNVHGLTMNARVQDRRLLAELDRRSWDSVTASVQARLTDEVIDRAMRRMPPEIQALSAQKTAARLKSRRESLPGAADVYYRLLSLDVDVHATDKRDVAAIDRHPDGSVEVRLYDADKEGQAHGDPYFDRRFVHGETNEIRVYMQGGDDRAVIRGESQRTLTVRIIGGGGDDILADSSRVVGRKAALYDDRGENRFIPGPTTGVDVRPFEAPSQTHGFTGETSRDGGRGLGTTPLVGFKGEDGLILGLMKSYTRFGFRRVPYAYTISAGAEVGTLSGAMAAEVSGDVRRENSRKGYSFLMRASQLQSFRFHGFGNSTSSTEDGGFYIVRRDELQARAMVHVDVLPRGTFSVGPVVTLGRNELPDGTPFALESNGARNTREVGALTELLVDRRDDIVYPRHGVRTLAGASVYPLVGGPSGAFGEAHATASAYWTMAGEHLPTLAVRAGGKKLWGDFPIHDAAFVGGSATLRGYPYQRFAGDAMTFGGAELRQPLGKAKLIAKGTLGVLLLADAGRVYYQGAGSDRWHGALGGGLWFHFKIRSTPLGASATFAQGETSAVYLKFGAPF